MFIFSHSVSFNPSFVIISFFYDLDKILNLEINNV
jgi:hypothetical protein